MSFEPRELLQHIKAEVDYLVARSNGMECDAFVADEDLRRAFARSPEIIGEAAKRIPIEFRRQHDQIDWRGMAGLRDRLIHGYFGIDYELVWEVVTTHIPTLSVHLDQVLSDDRSA